MSKQEISTVESLIHIIRGQKVILDSDLARIYGVTTKRLNEQVKRNAERFPIDFMFRLTIEDSELTTDEKNRSQIATGSQKHRDPKSFPYAFTEHGAIMGILKRIMTIIDPPPAPPPP
ncbi:MAG: ORF6N domain-containing protein, partial [Candidatus Omnitrophica bacterium]|nr:ORF6N domain-containing protein [Candidatus Omnitrophota bacterium]